MEYIENEGMSYRHTLIRDYFRLSFIRVLLDNSDLDRLLANLNDE